MQDAMGSEGPLPAFYGGRTGVLIWSNVLHLRLDAHVML